MTALLPARRSRSTSDSRLIPMINVVFLLLIFFMIAGQISALNPATVQLPLATSDVPPAAAELHLSLDRDGRLSSDGISLDAPALAQRLSALRPTSHVLISADQQLPVAVLDPVLQQLRSHQLSHVSLLSQQGVAP